MNPKYSQRFRLQMVGRMIGPNRVSAMALSAEAGVSQPTLSRWLRNAGTVPNMANETQQKPKNKTPGRWSPRERLEVVLEVSRLQDADLGEFLRSRGLHEAQVTEWRVAALKALAQPTGKRQRSAQDRRIRELEGELQRKEKALAEAVALLILQGKARAFWGAEGASTIPKSVRKRSN